MSFFDPETCNCECHTPGKQIENLHLETCCEVCVCGRKFRSDFIASHQANCNAYKIFAEQMQQLVDDMQTPKSRLAMQLAFNASSEELGRAAARQARK